jgi:hypothetical protein
MASKHVVVWPKVRVTVDGKPKVLEQKALVPAGVSETDLANLVSFGAIAGVSGGPDPVADSDDGAEEKPAAKKAAARPKADG